MLIIQMLGLLLGLMLRLLAIDEIHALGLGELIDLGAGEADEELFGELVGDGLAFIMCQLSFKFYLL